jgi:hypothetical protein
MHCLQAKAIDGTNVSIRGEKVVGIFKQGLYHIYTCRAHTQKILSSHLYDASASCVEESNANVGMQCNTRKEFKLHVKQCHVKIECERK